MLNNSIYSLQKRLLAVFVLVTFIFVAIIIRLFYVQVVKSDWLTAKACEQWYRSLPIKAERGEIRDANGVALAVSYSTFDIYVRAKMVDDPAKTALLLADNLGLSYDSVYKKCTNTSVGESTIKMQVDNDVAMKIVSFGLPGVVFTKNNKRYYPYGDLLTQVLGFTTIDNIGQGGLELYYDKYLKGVDGYALEESDVHGVKIDNSLSKYIPSISGMSVELTIDANIQRFLETALVQLVDEQRPKSATGIVMNARTGEVVAMSTKPSYDLNNIPRDSITQLLEMSRNVAICDVYEPGSTFKVLTMASAIEKGVAHLSDRFYDPGYRLVDGEKIKCWKLTGHGSQTLSEGLANSCNSVFIDLALRLGADKMYERFGIYNLGATLGVDFMGESSGILMSKASAKTVDLARMGFGQAIAVTPLQLVSALCSVVNGGNLMKPYFVQRISDVGGEIIYEEKPTIIRQTVSKSTSDTINVMLEEVIKKFSGFSAFIPGYRVGGKTGTTQKYNENGIAGTYIASFVGTFPANDPDYVILILADEPTAGSYYGSVVATPYAKLVIEDIIEYKNYPAENLQEDLQKLQNKIEIPNVVGMEINKAIYELEKLGFYVEVQGEGDMVVSQTPPAGTELCENSVLIITTN